MDGQVKSILMTTDTVGGVWSYSMSLAAGLQEHGINVMLVSMGREPSDCQRREAYGLSNVTLIETSFKLEWMSRPWDDVKESGELLLDLAERFEPDIVHLNGYSHAALPFAAPVLVVGHSCVCSWLSAVGSGGSEPWQQRYYREVSRGVEEADMVASPSRAMMRSLKEIYGRIRHSAVIYNGSDVEPLHVKKERFVFSAGRLWDEGKNIKCLQRAAGRIGWPVVVAGDNEHPDGSKADFANIELCGTLSKDRLIECMSRASIFALPARYEPFGLSVLEAARCGCCLVLGDIESLREIWQDAAIYVDPEDDGELAGQIERLINEPELLKHYGRKARQRASGFGNGRMVGQYVRLYRNMVCARRLRLHESEGVTIPERAAN